MERTFKSDVGYQSPNFTDRANDELKRGGDSEKARTLSILAVAQAIQDHAAEIASLATEGHPLHIWDMNR